MISEEQATQQQAARQRLGIEWWRSDEAYEHRCGMYLANMLLADQSNRRAPMGENFPQPEWPAIFVYEAETDMALWIECKSPTHIRDYMRACRSIHINVAALRVVEAN